MFNYRKDILNLGAPGWSCGPDLTLVRPTRNNPLLDPAQWFKSYTACGKIAAMVDKLMKSFALSLFYVCKVKQKNQKSPFSCFWDQFSDTV